MIYDTVLKEFTIYKTTYSFAKYRLIKGTMIKCEHLFRKFPRTSLVQSTIKQIHFRINHINQMKHLSFLHKRHFCTSPFRFTMMCEHNMLQKHNFFTFNL